MYSLLQLNKIIRDLRASKQYSKLPEEELLRLAKEKAVFCDRDLDIAVMFPDKKEKKKALDLFHKYAGDYSIETISDKNTLKQLIYLELVHVRLQEKLNDLQDKNAIPTNLIELVHKNLEQIVKLKDRMGITKTQQDTLKKDAFGAFDSLKKKFRIWLDNNQGHRTLVCPHCSKMILLKIKTDNWDAVKHPFFKDKVLCNEGLMEVYKLGKITKEEVAKILDCSSDYIDWMIEKYGQIEPELESGKTINEAQS